MYEPKNRNRDQSQERRKPREETQKPNTVVDPNETFMKDMSKALRNITQQMSRLKLDMNVPTLPPPRNSMGYRRPNNPQILQWERRNDGQTIQSHVWKDINNLKEEEEYLEELPHIEQEDEVE